MTERHDDVIHKAGNYVGSKEQLRSDSSRWWEVASSKTSQNSLSSHRSSISVQSKIVSMVSSQREKELMLAKL